MSQNMGITSLYLDRVGGAGPGVVDGVLTRSVFDLVFTSAGDPVAHVVKLPAAYAVKFENYRMAGLISASEARTIGGTTLLANHRIRNAKRRGQCDGEQDKSCSVYHTGSFFRPPTPSDAPECFRRDYLFKFKDAQFEE